MEDITKQIQAIAKNNRLPGSLNKLAEECAEYSAARIKYIMLECNEEEWISELADVMICIRQIEFHAEKTPVLKEKLEEEIKRKIDRQVRRIRGEET